MPEHPVDVRRQILIAADVDTVWGVVADGARQAEWFPGMVSSRVDNGIRTIGTAVGGFLMEEILGVDHEARCFEYRITGPMHLDHHRGRITVLEDPDGALVVYEQEMQPKALVNVLDAAIGDALEGLRDLVEDGRTSRSFVAPEADDRPDAPTMEEGS